MRLFSLLLSFCLLASISAYGDSDHGSEDKGVLNPSAEPSAPTRPRRPYTGQLSSSYKPRPSSTPAPVVSTRPSYNTPSQTYVTSSQSYHAHSIPFYGAPSQQSQQQDQHDDKEHDQHSTYEVSTPKASAPRPIYSQSSYTINLEPYHVAASKHQESGYYPTPSYPAPSVQPQTYRPQIKAPPTPSYGATTPHTPTKSTSYQVKSTHSFSTTSRPVEPQKSTGKPKFIPAYQPVQNLYPIQFVPFAPSKPAYHQQEQSEHHKESSSEDHKKKEEEEEEEEEEEGGDESKQQHHKNDESREENGGYRVQFDGPRAHAAPAYRGQPPLFSAIPVQVPIITAIRPHAVPAPRYRPKTIVKVEQKPQELPKPAARPQFVAVHHHQSSYQQQQQSRPVYQPVVHVQNLPTYQPPSAPAFKIQVPASSNYRPQPPVVAEYRPQPPIVTEYRPQTPAPVEYRPAPPAYDQESISGYQTVSTSVQPAASGYQVESSGIHTSGESVVQQEVYPDDLSAIPGEPGRDYPQMLRIPDSGFTCENKLPGYYADVETQCQVWHNCDTDGRKESFLCPNGTIYHQEKFVCDWWYNVDCSKSQDFYGVNAQLYIVPPKKEVVATQYEIKSQGSYETSQVQPQYQQTYSTVIAQQPSYAAPVPSVPAIAISHHQTQKSSHYSPVSQTRPIYGGKKSDEEEVSQSQNNDY